MSTYETTNTASLALAEQYLYGSSRLGVLDRKGRSYELTDHLGNVRAVVGDDAVVKSATDYYPFGMTANSYTPNGYRYGFNGREKDGEINDGAYDFDNRVYDSRTARWKAVDSYFVKYPSHSPYSFCMNSPIAMIDIDGDTVSIRITSRMVGYTQINLFSSGESKSKPALKKYKMWVPVYEVQLSTEGGETANFY